MGSGSFDLDGLLQVVRPVATSLGSAFHGEDHWRQVSVIGLDLATRTARCDATAVVVFAVLHDARRIGDDDDPQHGARGAALVRSLGIGRFGLSDDQLELIETACRDHTGGSLSADPTVGVCWDADRLTLGRVGIEPAAAYMSTAAGRASVSAMRRFSRTSRWSDVVELIGASSSARRTDRLRARLGR